MKHLATTLKTLLATVLIAVIGSALSGCSDEKYGIYLLSLIHISEPTRPY